MLTTQTLLLPVLLLGVALYVGHPALALALGAMLAVVFDRELVPGSSGYGKLLLQAAVVLLALKLDLSTIIQVSGDFLPIVAGYVCITLLVGLLFGRLLRTDAKSSQLLSAGTAICGGTAVASLAPVIRASTGQISSVLALVFLLNAIAIVALPSVGLLLEMTQRQFGLWVALAVHDTSSVVGTAAAYGEEALALATTVKLGRTLWLIPLLALWGMFVSGGQGKISVPVFVMAFAAVAGLNGLFTLPAQVAMIATPLSRWLLLAALFCIGLDMRRETLRAISPKLLLHALGLWLVVLPITAFVAMRFG